MAVLPGVLGCRPLRRTVQVRLGNPLGFLPTAVQDARRGFHAHLHGR